MIKKSDITIREFIDSDRKSIRQITFDTAFLGEPASIFFDDEKIFADTLSLYFTDYEPFDFAHGKFHEGWQSHINKKGNTLLKHGG